MVEQVVSGLDSRVADAAMGVGHTGKIFKQMAGKLDDRAVLDQHPAIVAKGRHRLGRRRSVPGGLLTDNHFQEPLQDVFKRLIQAETDRLPGGGVTGMRLDLCGQLVATGRSLKAFSAEGCEQTEEIDFSGGAFGEFQVFGQLAEIGFREEYRADGKWLGGSWRR